MQRLQKDVLLYHCVFPLRHLAGDTSIISEELFSVRDNKPDFMGFEVFVLWLHKSQCIQDNNGFHTVCLFRVFGNMM